MNLKQTLLISFIFIVRGILAIVVAFFASYFLAFAFAFASAEISSIGFWLYTLSFSITGFCGVFLGALCLKRLHRCFGSIALLLLGLAYSWHVIFEMDSINGELYETTNFVWLYALAAGGIGAVSVFWKCRTPASGKSIC